MNQTQFQKAAGISAGVVVRAGIRGDQSDRKSVV